MNLSHLWIYSSEIRNKVVMDGSDTKFDYVSTMNYLQDTVALDTSGMLYTWLWWKKNVFTVIWVKVHSHCALLNVQHIFFIQASLKAVVHSQTIFPVGTSNNMRKSGTKCQTKLYKTWIENTWKLSNILNPVQLSITLNLYLQY